MNVKEAEQLAISQTLEMIKTMMTVRPQINELLADGPVRKHLNLIYDDISSYIFDLERMK